MPSKLTTEEFVERAVKAHGDKYDYSLVVYRHSREKVRIICPVHGEFEQIADCHINSTRPCGCPVCAHGGTPRERFWRFVNKNGPISECDGKECWIWTGSRCPKGYGIFHAPGYSKTGGKSVKAHAFSYEIHFGKIPAKGNGSFVRMFICHHCDNPSCVNPDHLFLGTNSDNQRDRKKKGRCKLDWDQVCEIRQLWATNEYTQAQIGEMFDISGTHVGNIVYYRMRKET